MAHLCFAQDAHTDGAVHGYPAFISFIFREHTDAHGSAANGAVPLKTVGAVESLRSRKTDEEDAALCFKNGGFEERLCDITHYRHLSRVSCQQTNKSIEIK